MTKAEAIVLAEGGARTLLEDGYPQAASAIRRLIELTKREPLPLNRIIADMEETLKNAKEKP